MKKRGGGKSSATEECTANLWERGQAKKSEAVSPARSAMPGVRWL